MVPFVRPFALCTLTFLGIAGGGLGFLFERVQRRQPRTIFAELHSTIKAAVDENSSKNDGWWGRGGPPQKAPSLTLFPPRPSFSHYLVQLDDHNGASVPKPTKEKEAKYKKAKKPRRTTQVYKHLYRYYTDISVECWLATTTPDELLQSCGYTRDDLTAMSEEFPALLDLDVRGHLAPKVRFLVRTLGGGEGDICHGECLDEVQPAEDEECEDFHPHDLIVSDVTKEAVPPSYFGQRLERIVGPRHAYLEFCGEGLPHGSELLSDGGMLLREFLDVSGKPTAEFAALCNRWAKERSSFGDGDGDDGTGSAETAVVRHTAERIDAFQRAFGRGLLAAARNDHPSDELEGLVGCTPGRMAELLIRHGANPIEHDRSGASLLHWAAGTGNLCGAEAILSAMDPKAAEEGRVGEVLLTTCGEKDGATPLHWASCGVDHNTFGCGGHVDVCRFFIDEAGEDSGDLVNSQTWTGNTPLMWACWSGSLDVAKLLISFGADPRAQNSNGCGVAHWASSGGDLEMCKYLHHELGVGFRTENTAEHTPLNHAISYGRLDVVKWIISTFYPAKDDVAALQREIDLAKEFVDWTSGEEVRREVLQVLEQGSAACS